MTHAHMHARTYTHTPTHTHTRAHTHTHTAVMSDWEKLLLRGEIQKAVESVIAKIEG